jgi:hypothetical protein
VNARPRDLDARSVYNPQSLVDLFEETVDALFVDALCSLEDFEADARNWRVEYNTKRPHATRLEAACHRGLWPLESKSNFTAHGCGIRPSLLLD